MENPKLSVPLIVIFASFICYAIPATMIGPAIPPLMKDLGIDPSTTGLLKLVASAGSLLSVLGGVLADVYGYGLIASASFGLFVASLASLSLSNSLEAVLASFLIMGIAASFLESTLNPLVLTLGGRLKGRIINLFHSAWNIGASLGPLLSSLLIMASGDWHVPYLVALAIMSSLMIPFAVIVIKYLPRVSKPPLKKVKSKNLLPDLKILLLSLSMFFYLASEHSINMWSVTIMINLGTDYLTASASTSIFWSLMGIGRILWSLRVDRWGYRITLMSSGLIASIVTLLVLYAKMDLAVIACWAILGLLYAPIYPTIMAWAYSITPNSAGASAGLIYTVGILGAAASGWAVGYLLSYFTVEAAIMFLSITIACSAIVSWTVSSLEASSRVR